MLGERYSRFILTKVTPTAMLLTLYFLLILVFNKAQGHNESSNKPEEQIGSPGARRILKGMEASDTRPYMVYLRAANSRVGGTQPDPNWLCGGVIVHPLYILTSAACIEDTTQFYVISGTHKWLPSSETNTCIKNGALRAVWKCTPKTYTYDGNAPNNIRWMVNDIAVVKVEEPINFRKRVKGCDFIPQMIAYNNVTSEMEKAGTHAFIAGWGSTYSYTDVADGIARSTANSAELLEAEVFVIQKDKCKRFWHPRYHSIIEENMICGRNIETDDMSQACLQNHVSCRQLILGEENDVIPERSRKKMSDRHLLRSLARVNKLKKARRKGHRRDAERIGGFCENDHGGPLVVGQGKSSVVIGIITAYQTMNQTKRCIGPFLYTSVWNNRHLISCAIYKDLGTTCRTLLRSSNTILEEKSIEWPEYTRFSGPHDKIVSERQHSKERKRKKMKMRSSRDRANLVDILNHTEITEATTTTTGKPKKV